MPNSHSLLVAKRPLQIILSACLSVRPPNVRSSVRYKRQPTEHISPLRELVYLILLSLISLLVYLILLSLISLLVYLMLLSLISLLVYLILLSLISLSNSTTTFVQFLSETFLILQNSDPTSNYFQRREIKFLVRTRESCFIKTTSAPIGAWK